MKKKTGKGRGRDRSPRLGWALIFFLAALVLGWSLAEWPMGVFGPPPRPEGVGPFLGWAPAGVLYTLLGFAAYLVPLFLLLALYPLLAMDSRRRKLLLLRGVLLVFLAACWAEVVNQAHFMGYQSGGILGDLFGRALESLLGPKFWGWAGLGILLLLTPPAAGLRLGTLLLPFRLFFSRAPERKGRKEEGRAQPSKREEDRPPSPAPPPVASPPEPAGKEPLPLSILPDPPEKKGGPGPGPEDLPPLAARVARVAHEVAGIRIEPLPGESHIGLSSLVLAFRKAPEERRSVTRLEKALKDIGLELGRSPVRLELGDVLRFQLPLKKEERSFVGLKPLLEECPPRKGPPLYVLGRTQEGEPFLLDAEKAVHILVAGETGGGKSVLLHAMIFSLLFRYPPSGVWLALADFKGTEFHRYAGAPHLWHPPCLNEGEFPALQARLEAEMERRKKIVRADPAARLPYLFVFLDEFSGLDTRGLVRLFAQARAFRIRFVMATQYPKASVVTTEIKANLTTRVALSLRDGYASRTVLDSSDATTLSGAGDCLVQEGGGLTRIQVPWVRDESHGDESELKALVDYLTRKQT